MPAANDARCFAVIPAAGHSRRMGTDKLLLAWREKTLIEHLLDAWLSSTVFRIVVVTRATAGPLRHVLSRYGDRLDTVICDVEPRDMKQSIQAGLQFLAQRYGPTERDAWLVAPADMPQLQSATIDQVCRAHCPVDPRVVVPWVDGRRGHPVLLPWILAESVFRLPEDQGLNRIVDQADLLRLPLEAVDALRDVDTPAEYAALTADLPSQRDLKPRG